MPSEEEISEIEAQLKGFLLGLSQSSYEQTFRAQRQLSRLGQAVIPPVERWLMNQAWDRIQYGAQLNLLTGMLSLVHDVDESHARELAGRIKRSGCTKVVSVRVDSITSFSVDAFDRYEVLGVKVYESKRIRSGQSVRAHLETWLRGVPPDDLADISRVYVVPSDEEDVAGTYLPILCNIMIVWPLSRSMPLGINWLFLLNIEQTLYHEIGHHSHRHTFGRDPDQEREADRYAAKLLVQNHRWLRALHGLRRLILGGRR
jgi:hypothetical protein